MDANDLKQIVDNLQAEVNSLEKALSDNHISIRTLQNFAESMLILLPSIDRRINRLDEKLKEIEDILK